MEPAGACQSGLPISLTGSIATVSQHQSTMQPADRFRAHLDMRKTMRLIHALLAACWAGAPLTAQTNTERIANDHYTRSHDYDLIHQKIEVSHFDWDSTSFDGRVTTTLVARRATLDSVILDAGAKLLLKRVTGTGGAALRTARSGDTLVVFFAKPIAFGDTVHFIISYHGVVENGRGLTYISPDRQPHRPRQIWS